MHQKIEMFLRERDRALARGDGGVVRSMDAELRRLGIPDDATLEHPTGKPKSRRPRVANVPPVEAPPKNHGRPKLPRCEHENVAERCPECNPELIAH